MCLCYAQALNFDGSMTRQDIQFISKSNTKRNIMKNYRSPLIMVTKNNRVGSYSTHINNPTCYSVVFNGFAKKEELPIAIMQSRFFVCSCPHSFIVSKQKKNVKRVKKLFNDPKPSKGTKSHISSNCKIS